MFTAKLFQEYIDLNCFFKNTPTQQYSLTFSTDQLHGKNSLSLNIQQLSWPLFCKNNPPQRCPTIIFTKTMCVDRYAIPIPKHKDNGLILIFFRTVSYSFAQTTISEVENPRCWTSSKSPGSLLNINNLVAQYHSHSSIVNDRLSTLGTYLKEHLSLRLLSLDP